MVAIPVDANGNLSLTEQHLTSLFALYPEITFDSEVQHAVKLGHQLYNELNSSPLSTPAEDLDRSYLSQSTAHTTPLRPLYLVQRASTRSLDTVAGYIRQVRQSDLPEECRLCFTSLAHSIGAISAGMVPSTNGRYRINNTYFTDQCSAFLRELKHLSGRTREQIKQVDYLKSLVIFKATPSDDMLWPLYRQRVQLIVRLVALPSPSEKFLINNLAHLYNQAVYQPSQVLYDDNEIEAPTMRILNKIYDLLFGWTTSYREWCLAMKDLKQRYMTPLVDRILMSQALFTEVASMQQVKSKAGVAITNPTGPSMLPMDEKVIKELNLSARRKEAFVLKRKARFRREKTI